MKNAEQELLKKFGVSESWIEDSAQAYETESWNPSEDDGPIFIGSHLDRVGKKRVTVIFDAADAQRVKELAKKRGVRPSDIYREALKTYLVAQV